MSPTAEDRAIADLQERMQENSLEIAVYNGRTDLFNPCVSIPEMNFSPETPAKLLQAIKPYDSQIKQVGPGVGRMRVEFETTGISKPTYWYPTCFAVSPTVLFTDVHCVPVNILKRVREKAGNQRFTFKQVSVSMENPSVNSLYLKSAPTIPCKILSRSDLLSGIDSVDPISNLVWDRSPSLDTDLAAMAIEGSETLQQYFLPSAVDVVEGQVTCLMGFPRQPTSAEFDSVFKYLSKTGFDFFATNCHGFPKGHAKYREESIETIKQCYNDAFCNYDTKCLSYGTIIKVGKREPGKFPLMATDVSTTIGCSGSPYFSPSDPQFIIGQHLGSGVGVVNSDRLYNCILGVDHPEWIAKWVKFALPTLPASDYPKILPYLKKHSDFLKKEELITPLIDSILAQEIG